MIFCYFVVITTSVVWKERSTADEHYYDPSTRKDYFNPGGPPASGPQATRTVLERPDRRMVQGREHRGFAPRAFGQGRKRSTEATNLPKDAEIVVYCGGPKCPQSRMAAEKLAKLGFENVRAYEGGLEEWKAAGFAVEKA